MHKQRRQGGFSTLELILILVVIGVLLALVITSRAGVQQNRRDSERQSDIKELRDGLEGYFAATNHYPTLNELNDNAWRNTHLKSIEDHVFRDPSGSDNKFTDKPTANVYTYSVTSASGNPCGSAESPCTQYTLSASLEGGGLYTKYNLN
jgi:type II secretory pathway pseudopilin PulG